MDEPLKQICKENSTRHTILKKTRSTQNLTLHGHRWHWDPGAPWPPVGQRENLGVWFRHPHAMISQIGSFPQVGVNKGKKKKTYTNQPTPVFVHINLWVYQMEILELES